MWELAALLAHRITLKRARRRLERVAALELPPPGAR
jgi:hypothetical protein